MFSAATKTGSQPSAAANYIEDVFSTYLYDGTSANQTINNGIDLAGKGGLVWIKQRQGGSTLHGLFDTIRGANNYLASNATVAQNGYGTFTDLLTSFNSNGFSLGADSTPYGVNWSPYPTCSWTFRKQPKFFDVVTYTGNGVAGRTVAHNLGSVPGMIIVKNCTTGSYWRVYHQSLGATQNLKLNLTDAAQSATNIWNDTAPTSTQFTVGDNGNVNESGATMVAYLFASNAGGFGTSGTDNVISCGSFTTTSGIQQISLGYEPQYVLMKQTNSTGNWFIWDVMRGESYTVNQYLYANSANAEAAGGAGDWATPTSTGFQIDATGIYGSGATYIYMAIRRPMKVPTDATTVFKPVAQNGGGTVTTGFPVDLSITPYTRSSPTQYVIDRLRGTSSTASQYLITRSTGAEATNTSGFGFDNNIGYLDSIFTGGGSAVYWNFSRRPGFFDEVCYTGDGTTNKSITHNLSVVPNMIITKGRSSATAWRTWASSFVDTSYDCSLQSTAAVGQNQNYTTDGRAFSATNYYVSSGANISGYTYVSYLFATCPGVSKVGSYTGNGGTQAISCGFTGGARFVLIKRTDSTGDWYVYDTARGMTTLVDPYLLLNSTASESASLGSVTSTAGGFTVNASILAAINTSGASYIFLAIA